MVQNTFPDFNCIAPKPLLEGRRRFDGVMFRTRNFRSGYPSTEARLSGDGWCSGQQGENIFDDPFLEVDFGGQNVIFDSVATQGFSITDLPIILKTVFTERYQIEVLGQDRVFRLIAAPSNSTHSNPAVSLDLYNISLTYLSAHVGVPTWWENQ